MLFRLFFSVFILFSVQVLGQLRFSGHGEVFYTYDFERPFNNVRDAWFYNHNLHNTIAPNMMLLEGSYKKKGVYAQLDLMFGSYGAAVMRNEPIWALPIYQAYVGTRVGEVELEMGIFESGIGMESAKGYENPTLTRSIFAENTPYFLSGARARWEDRTAIIMIEGAVINGWETVTRHAVQLANAASGMGGMMRMRLGSKKVHLHYNFLYTEDVGGYPFRRVYRLHGGYFKHALTDWHFFLGYDNVGGNEMSVHMPYAIVRRVFSERFSAAVRGEYARDNSLHYFLDAAPLNVPKQPQGVPDGVTLDRNFQVWSASINVDYAPKKNLLFRAEFRYIDGENAVNVIQPQGGSQMQISNNFDTPYLNRTVTLSAFVMF
ncbi:MAG: outer membrane beta-barrel protein [Cryomorphaceae bacterium]|nr:outer membrane beta-barrel protein [Cryomorphaceae bacterium]